MIKIVNDCPNIFLRGYNSVFEVKKIKIRRLKLEGLPKGIRYYSAAVEAVDYQLRNCLKFSCHVSKTTSSISLEKLLGDIVELCSESAYQEILDSLQSGDCCVEFKVTSNTLSVAINNQSTFTFELI